MTGSAGEGLVDEPFEPDVLAHELKFHGRVWDVVSERFAYGNGQLTRDFVDHTGAVAVLALDADDRVLLIQQYRHPIRMREWELPAGLLDIDGEDPLDAAKRELAEEVDLVAAEWALLAEWAVSPGGSNELVRVYLARGLAATESTYPREAEEADIVTRWVALDEAVDAVLSGGIQNTIAVVGLQAAALLRGRGWVGLRNAQEPWRRRRR